MSSAWDSAGEQSYGGKNNGTRVLGVGWAKAGTHTAHHVGIRPCTQMSFIRIQIRWMSMCSRYSVGKPGTLMPPGSRKPRLPVTAVTNFWLCPREANESTLFNHLMLLPEGVDNLGRTNYILS